MELASLADGALVLPAVAAALGGLEDAAGDASALMARLVARLSEDEHLLVIDNCEHLLDAATAVVQTLLSRCPHLLILTTSRQRLGLPGEIADAVLALAEMFLDDPDLDKVWRYPVEAREQMQAVGDPVGLARSLEWLAGIAWKQGDRCAAGPLVEEWLAICRKLGDPELLMPALSAMADIARGEGDYARARVLYEERLAICRELGNPNLLIHVLGGMGHVARNEGDYARARSLYAESLALRCQHDYRPAIAQSLEDLAALARREHQSARSIRLLGAAEALGETLGTQPPAASREEYECAVAQGRAALGEAAFAPIWAEGRAMSGDQAVAYALSDPAVERALIQGERR